MTAPLRPLSDLATIQTGIPFVTCADPDGGEPVLLPAALRDDGEMMPGPSMVQRVQLLTVAEDRYRLAPEDILITAKASPSNLRTSYLSVQWPNRWLFAANLIRVHARAGSIHPIYLHAWFCHPDGRAALIAASQSTTGQLNLTASSISKLQVPVPPWQTQIKAVELLHAASLAHRHAIAAAELRLALAREIALSPKKMKTNESPKLLIHSPGPDGRILTTENGKGECEPNSRLWDDVRQALDSLPDRPLANLLDPNSIEMMHLDRTDFAGRLAQELRCLLDVCASHQNETIRMLGKDAVIDLDFFVAHKLGIPTCKQSVSHFLITLDCLPPEPGIPVQIRI